MKTALLILLVSTAQAAQADMWKCVDPDGIAPPRYTNVKADSKGCKPVILDPISSVAPPARAQQKPANFPSVDNDTQKQRDVGRRKILEQELAQEQQQLEAARKQLAEQKDQRAGNEKNKPLADQVRLHENNVESLKKEITNTR